MAPNLKPASSWGKSPRLVGGRDEAKKMRRRRIESAFYQLMAEYRHEGSTDSLARNRQRCADEFDAGPILPFDQALLADGRMNRTIDEARELCLHEGATLAEKRTFIVRARRYALDLLTYARSAEVTLPNG